MGFVERLKSFFGKNDTEDLEVALHVHIESATEKLRAFSVTVNRMEAEQVVTSERIHLIEKEASLLCEQAERAIEENDERKARQLLETSQAKKNQLESSKAQLSQLNVTLGSLKADYSAIQQLIQEAKDKLHSLIRRNQNALAKQHVGSMSAYDVEVRRVIERMKDEILLAEAKAELASVSVHGSLDDEFEKLEREKNN
ncbi:PspA/IM30 family protein [Paenibacillus cymbidii]|uniref:PspA/IM30 family protein n=1 Tax=Paenibacillus cymbidii TaxID=1639034 RepID=UPI0010809B2F|nr:PspA/IM30 family protein [Paenibacillus cymbidii]